MAGFNSDQASKKWQSERWNPIKGFPDYEISDHGRVKSKARRVGIPQRNGTIAYHWRTQKLLKPAGVYPHVTLTFEGAKTILSVHRLVALAFLPKPKKGQDSVLHADDNPKNPHYSNLRWGTQRDNTDDMLERNRYCRGEKQHTAKLTASLVKQIAQAIVRGSKRIDIATRFNIDPTTIGDIKAGRTWNHVTGFTNSTKTCPQRGVRYG